jgi:hypothetical protein
VHGKYFLSSDDTVQNLHVKNVQIVYTAPGEYIPPRIFDKGGNNFAAHSEQICDIVHHAEVIDAHTAARRQNIHKLASTNNIHILAPRIAYSPCPGPS